MGAVVGDGEGVVEAVDDSIVGAVEFVVHEGGVGGEGAGDEVVDPGVSDRTGSADGGLHVEGVLAEAEEREEVVVKIAAGGADAEGGSVEAAGDLVTGGADGVGEVGEPSGDARDGTEVAGEIAAVAVAQVIAADEAVVGKRGAVGGEGGLGAGVVDGADEVGVGRVDVFAPLRFHGAGVVLVLLGVKDELLLHPRKFQVVDGGDAHIAHDVASDVTGAEIFAVELVVVRIDGAAGEVGRKVAVDRAASGGAPGI